MNEPALTQHMDTCLDGQGWAMNTYHVHADGVPTGIKLIERYETVPNSKAKKLTVRVLSCRGDELNLLDRTIGKEQRIAWVQARLPQPLHVDDVTRVALHERSGIEDNPFLRDA